MYHGAHDEQFHQDPYMESPDDQIHIRQPVNNNTYYYDDDDYDNPILEEGPYHHRQTFMEVDTTAHEANFDIAPPMRNRSKREASHSQPQPVSTQRDSRTSIPPSNFAPPPIRPSHMDHDQLVMREHQRYPEHSSHQINKMRKESTPRTSQPHSSSDSYSVPSARESYASHEEDYVLEHDRPRDRKREAKKDRAREKDRDRDRHDRKKNRNKDQDRSKTSKSKSKTYSHAERDKERNNESRSKKENKKSYRHEHVDEASFEASPNVKYSKKNKDSRKKKDRHVNNNYENNSYKDSSVKKRNKTKMPMLKKIAIASCILLLLVVVTLSVLIVTKQKGNKKESSSSNVNTGLRPAGTPSSTSNPTPYPTMSPTSRPLTPRPTPTSNIESGNVNCPTVQELSGLCNRDDDDDYYLNNAPSPYQNTGQGGLPTPVTPTEDCPMYLYVLGSCGTRVPTMPPATRQPVAVVSADAVCTPEKFQRQIFINEFHYNNARYDFAEFIEIAHSTDLNLSGFKIEFYDGISGKVYKTTSLGDTVPAVTSSDPNGGSVTFSAYSQMNFHDGPAGIAIVDPNNYVVEFIGYGGANFTATNGAATGMVPYDIGVYEPEDSSFTLSLQLDGVGGGVFDFKWNMPNYGTPGKINEGQVFMCY